MAATEQQEPATIRSLVREVSREVTATVGNKEESLSEQQLLVLIAVSALTKLETSAAEAAEKIRNGDGAGEKRRKEKRGSEEDDHVVDGGEHEDLRKTAKRCRKQLQGFVADTLEENRVQDEEGLDLGQYAHTQVFDGNDKKAAKFARLMGGAKGIKDGKLPAGARSPHATYAPSHEQLAKITLDVEEQFSTATAHKGKRGLGM